MTFTTEDERLAKRAEYATTSIRVSLANGKGVVEPSYYEDRFDAAFPPIPQEPMEANPGVAIVNQYGQILTWHGLDNGDTEEWITRTIAWLKERGPMWSGVKAPLVGLRPAYFQWTEVPIP